jgi:hypothetical protein
VSRRQSDDAIHLSIDDAPRGPELQVDADAEDGSFEDFDRVTAVVGQPGGGRETIAVEPIAPGRYAAPVSPAGTGPYVVALAAHDRQTGVERRVVRALYWSADRERQAQGTNLRLLSRIASITGGRQLEVGESPFDTPRAPAYRDASTWMAAAALAVFLLELVGGGIDAAIFRTIRT